MKPMCEPMEEQMEIVLTSRQIFVLAILIVGVALVMFVVGFSMGKRAERRKLVVGTPQATADLLARLDEMEKESREFVAKKALTEVRKQEVPVEELPPASGSDKQVAPKMEQNTPQAAGSAPQAVSGRKTSGTLALTRVKPVKTAPAKASNARPAAVPVSAAPVSHRQVSGSFGRARRTEPPAARRTESGKVAARN